MKKFEEEIFGKVETMITQPGCSMTRKVWYSAGDIHDFSKGWVSPEDHQSEIDQLKSQLEKQQPEIPEVPQFVADWYEENKDSLDYMIYETCRNLTDESTDEFENWFGYDENKAITTLVHMKNGYTVAKEERFYLKDKNTKLYLWKDLETPEPPLIGVSFNDRHLDESNEFTQQEIDSMETGSYEQIEVTE